MNGCFGCDPANPGGLAMRFFRDRDGRLCASCVPGELHRGLGRIVNGGLVATFAEELAAAAAGAEGSEGLVVSRVEVQYERPGLVGNEMKGVVTSTSVDGRSVAVAVDVMSRGERIAALKAAFVLISEAKLRELAGIGLDAAPACLVAGRKLLPSET